MSKWTKEAARQATADALAIEGFLERRAALRKLAEATLRDAAKWKEYTVAAMLNHCPLVGEGEGQVKVRPTIAGLRDQLHERALANLAAAVPACAARVSTALKAPDTEGVHSPRAKCGYEFGVHSEHKTIDELREWLASEGFVASGGAAKGTETETETETDSEAHAGETGKEETETMTKMETVSVESIERVDVKAWALGALVRAWFAVKLESGAEDGAVTEAMRMCVTEDSSPRVDGVAAYIGTLGEDERPESVEMRELGELARSLAQDMLVQLRPVDREVGASKGEGELGLPDEKHADLIDLALERSGLPSIREIIKRVNEGAKEKAGLMAMLEEAKAEAKRAIEAAARRAAALPSTGAVEATGEVPSGSFEMRKASEVFGLEKGKEMFGFEVPVWTWDGVNPHVPTVNEGYVFRPHELFAVLMGVVGKAPTYLHGHTGTGKTTLVEQVAARLGYMFMRLNFDSDISRMDLIGRDTLVTEGGATVSRFVDGILPQMMQAPVMACFDEIDFVRPDISYVMQRALENDSLVLTEDGGRVVRPHPMFRIFATGNTVGQGDEHGMYQGARPQSLAFLDRFTNWIEVKYLEEDDREKLVRAAAPGLGEDGVRLVCAYVKEHLAAFTASKVLQPLSPRGYCALAERVATYTGLYPSAMKKEAVKRAFESTVLARANVQDRVVLAAIVDRLA